MPQTATSRAITRLLNDATREHVLPGAVWATGSPDGQEHTGVVGQRDPETGEPMRTDTLFDLASLTKIIAVWAPLGTQIAEGRVALTTPLADVIPDTRDHDLAEVTVAQLLTHTAGVPLRARLRELYGTNPAAIRRGVLQAPRHRPPGEAVEYTDRAALILGWLVEALDGAALDQIATKRIWTPLGMDHTHFGPLPDDRTHRAAPTEPDLDAGHRLRGVAHDYSARLLGGVCGIAGVFAPLADLLRFARAVSGAQPAPATIPTDWVTQSLHVHTAALTPPRGLFWHPAPDTAVEQGLWCHYGFTGVGIWVQPSTGRYALLLSNKLYYSRDREPLKRLRGEFAKLAFPG